MEKRGQFQISFGMIFSIIIIVATLAVASYVLVKFVHLGANVSCKLLYDDLQERIDIAWRGDGATSAIFTHTIPKSAQTICFGNASAAVPAEFRNQKEELHFYSSSNDNLFFYPPTSEACGGEGFAYQLKHSSAQEFFCISPSNGKVKMQITKGVRDALVTIQP